MNNILLKNAGFCYIKDDWIYRSIDLEIPKSTILTIVGKSGIGKTTFAKTLSGLLEVQEGKFVNTIGKSVIMFQNSLCLPWLTCLKNVMISSSVDRITAQSVLNKMGLKEKINYYPAQLSGGMRTRLATAIAIAKDAKVLIFDEPFSGLDAINIKNSISFLKKLRKDGKTIILISHDIFNTLNISDSFLILKSDLKYEKIDITNINPNDKKKNNYILDLVNSKII